MGRAENRNKAQATAAWLAKHSPVRLTGQCPWGCGRPVANGGAALLKHLGICQGNPRYDGRTKKGKNNG